MSVEKEMGIIIKALKDDPGYRISWNANIAMAFVDEWREQTQDDVMMNVRTDFIHRVANRAADRFLNMLIAATEGA